MTSTVDSHFDSVFENLVPVDGNKILETKLSEKKKSALLENINVSLLKVYPAYVATMKSCETKGGDSAAFAAFKLQWSESMELKWKPKIGPIHMLGFFLDPRIINNISILKYVRLDFASKHKILLALFFAEIIKFLINNIMFKMMLIFCFLKDS